MPTTAYRQLLLVARRCTLAHEAEDLLQEALLEAARQDRHDLRLAENRRWISGVIRNKAREAARGAVRRRRREGAWQALRDDSPPVDGSAPAFLQTLPPALKAVAVLALSGHTRREIAYLLKLEDTTLRQRISALKRRLRAAGISAPDSLPGLPLDLPYGRIRDALLPALHRHRGMLATDGHLFVLRRSQKQGGRQPGLQTTPKEFPP